MKQKLVSKEKSEKIPTVIEKQIITNHHETIPHESKLAEKPKKKIKRGESPKVKNAIGNVLGNNNNSATK